MVSRFIVRRRFALRVAVLAVLVPALAGAQTKEEQGCILAMNKAASKVAKSQGKLDSGCISSDASGKLAMGQTATSCIALDEKGKVQKSIQKTIDTQTTKCPSAPPYGFGGATATNDAAVNEEIELSKAVFGTNIDGALTNVGYASCQGAVAKSYEKLAATRLKDFNKCKSGGFKLATITDASGLVACMGAAVDYSGKMAGARDKLQSTIESKCVNPVNLAAAFPGCSQYAASAVALADCIARKTECAMCLLINGADALSAPCDALDDGVLNGSCRQCGNNSVDSQEQCDDGGDSGLCDFDCTYAACGDGYTNAAAGELCDDGNLVAGDDCEPGCDHCGDGNVDAGEGEECDDGNLVDGDGCDPDCRVQAVACPTKGELMLLAGAGSSCVTNGDCVDGSTCDPGLSRCVSATELDAGYTGLGHDADINDRVVTAGDLVCAGPGPLCGQCDVVGLIPRDGNCRCKNDTRVICDQPFVPDADDCGGDLCNCFFGPPLPTLSGGVAACIVNQFARDISGTANVDTGAGKIDSRLNSVVFLGENQYQPCPVCGGTCTAGTVGQDCGKNNDCDTSEGANDGVCGNWDPTPNDGIRGGKCFGGQNDNASCDIHAINTTFPAPSGGGGGHSLDCYPSVGKNVSGTGLKIPLSQTTGTVSLPPAALTCDNGFGLCPCGKCSLDPLQGCTSNADCAGVGTCAALPSQKQNNCDDMNCQPAGGGEGYCPANPLETYCDGIVRGNGEGMLACLQNADCAAINIGFNGGNCTLTRTRECLLDPVTATGFQDADTPLGVSTICAVDTANAAINNAVGLPGAVRVKNQAKSTLYCAGNPLDLYVPGVGCP